MTMPTETPGVAASPGAGNGAVDPNTGQAAVPQPEPTSAGPEGDRATDDRSEETLEERVRTFQSKYDAEQAAHRKLQTKLGELGNWLDQLGGGDNALALLRHYATHPEFGKFVDELNRSGTIASPLVSPNEPDEDDEYLDPAVKALRDQNAQLQNDIQQLKNAFDTQRSSAGAERFTSHVQAWLAKYPDLTAEEIERVRERGESTVTKIGARVAELGEQDVSTLMRGTFSDDEWNEVIKRGVIRGLQNQQDRGTDSPSHLATGNEPESLTGKDARSIWREAMRRIQ